MSYASSRAWALKETFRGFRQNFSLFSLATFLSALALSIPLFISTIFYELAEPIRQIPTSVEITVFTKSGTDMEKLQSRGRNRNHRARLARAQGRGHPKPE